jgi:hypothetical protein
LKSKSITEGLATVPASIELKKRHKGAEIAAGTVRNYVKCVRLMALDLFRKVVYQLDHFIIYREPANYKEGKFMLNKEPNARSNIVILTAIAIAGIALMLSILSYQFFIIASNKIVDIASQEVRSNVRIEVHDISQILANKLQNVGSLLQTLAESPALVSKTSLQRAAIDNFENLLLFNCSLALVLIHTRPANIISCNYLIILFITGLA